MNRSLRLLRAPVLRQSPSPARSSILAQRSLGSSPCTSPATSILAAVARPAFHPVHVRLFVTSSRVSAEGKDPAAGKSETATDQQGIVSSAVAEAKGVVRDIASIISGGQEGAESTPPKSSGGPSIVPEGPGGNAFAAMESSSHSHGGSVRDDFTTITKGLLQSVPKHVMVFGLAGTLPYLGTSIGTVLVAREADRTGHGLSTITGMNFDTAMDTLHTLEALQITYGAIILSFLGALHWGMEFSKMGGTQGYSRLLVGTVPLFFAWPTTFMTHGIALATQWVGFTLTWFFDQRATNNGWTPRWYATYRFYLSIIVGFAIIGTLTGESYYGFGAGSDVGGDMVQPTGMKGTPTPRFVSYRDKEKYRQHEIVGNKGEKKSGKVGGDIYVEQSDDLQAYGRLKKRSAEAEEEEEGGGEDAEKEEGKDEESEEEK